MGRGGGAIVLALESAGRRRISVVALGNGGIQYRNSLFS